MTSALLRDFASYAVEPEMLVLGNVLFSILGRWSYLRKNAISLDASDATPDSMLANLFGPQFSRRRTLSVLFPCVVSRPSSG